MPNLQEVDYEQMPKQAEQMRDYAKSLNTELVAIYQSISNMHKSWYGKRYNELVQEFNDLIPALNEMLDIVVGDIPYSIEVIANNYSQADRYANVTNAQRSEPQKIENLQKYNDVGMRFITSEVDSVKNDVSTKFDSAEGKMNTIESTYKQISWQSEAAEAYRIKFTKLKGEIVAEFANIKSQFVVLMNKTEEDMDKTEKANTVE